MARKFSIRGLLSLKDTASPVAAKAQGRLGKLGTAMKVGLVAGAAAATAGLVALTKGISSSIAAAKTQEDAVNRLEGALASLGPEAGRVSKALQEQAAALQQTSKFGDEQIIEAQALIASFVKEESAIKAATKATLDLAAGKGIDLKVAADLVSKSLGSSTNALSRYGITVEGAVGSTDRLKTLTEGIATTFGGQAAKQAETFSGRIQQLSNAFGDILEVFGDAIIKNTALKGSLKGLTDLLQSATTQNAIKGIIQGIGDLVTNLVAAGKAVAPFASVMFEVVKTIVTFSIALNKLIIAGLKPLIARALEFVKVFSPIINVIKGLISAIGGGISSFSDFADGLSDTKDAADESSKALVDNATKTRANTAAVVENTAATIEGKDAKQEDAEVTAEQAVVTEDAAEAVVELTIAEQAAAASTRELSVETGNLNLQLAALQQQVSFTTRTFDELARTQGNAAAVTAGLAAGGSLTLQGRRINLPGGGSRIVDVAPRFAENTARFNIDGSPRRIG